MGKYTFHLDNMVEALGLKEDMVDMALKGDQEDLGRLLSLADLKGIERGRQQMRQEIWRSFNTLLALIQPEPPAAMPAPNWRIVEGPSVPPEERE